MKLPLLLLLLLKLAPCGAQTSPAYTPFTPDPEMGKTLSAAIAQRYEQDVAALSGPYKKERAEIYKDRHDYLQGRIENGEVLLNREAQAYLDRLAAAILQGNPSLPRHGKLRILFSRSGRANAASMGEGTILFNIGLFHRLQSEAQAAFVLCHELAHYYLDHGNSSILDWVKTVNSDAYQQRLRQLATAEFGVNRGLEKLAESIGFAHRRHSRAHEGAADSMAVVLMQAAGFDPREAIGGLRILDSSEREKYYVPLGLDSIFHSPVFPFRPRWLQSDALAFTDTEEDKQEEARLKDSLKTHPDVAQRTVRLERMLAGSGKPKGATVDPKTFAQLQAAYDYEILRYSYEADEISTALYLALQLYRRSNGDAYALGTIGKCLSRLYTAQKEHTLNRIVDLPGPAYDAEYNALLHLIQNLRLSELNAIAFHFLTRHAEAGKGDEDFVAALIQAADRQGAAAEKRRWIQHYTATFPKGVYTF